MKWGPEYAQKHDLSKIRLLGTVGEADQPEAWIWYREHIGGDNAPGRRYLVADRDRNDPDRLRFRASRRSSRASASRPFPGVDAAVYDESSNEIGPVAAAYLVLRKPLAGDAGAVSTTIPTVSSPTTGRCSRATTPPATALASTRTATSGLMGRVDDVMNVSGHRLSTIEIESARLPTRSSPRPRSAVAPIPSPARPSFAFVTLKGGKEG